MLKRITAFILALLLGLCVVGHLHRVSERNAAMLVGRSLLKAAAADLSEYGCVTNVSSSCYRLWLSSNVVTIGTTQYHCYVELGGGLLHDEGTLAITTNQVFLWLDSTQAPKIIDAHYRAPLFPSRF